MTKTKTTPTLAPYPPPLREESGSKVGWNYYATETEARVASKTAIREAERLEALGYDWGYQSPGRITVEQDGTYRVCVP